MELAYYLLHQHKRQVWQGVKVGIGEIDASNDAYTAGSTSYASTSASADSEFAAIFAEVERSKVDGLSIGAEYIPLG